MYERFVSKGVVDLRVDLQPMARDGPSCHHGSPEYALLLCQHGFFPDRRGMPFGGSLTLTMTLTMTLAMTLAMTWAWPLLECQLWRLAGNLAN
jgi:hypothetical protein